MRDFRGFQGTLVSEELVEVPAEKKKEYIFVEYEAELCFFYKENFVKNMGCFSDFYGEFSCIKGAIESAISIGESLEISENSEAHIEVSLKKEYIRKRKTGRKIFGTDQDEYERLQTGWRLHSEEKVIWSSRKPEDAEELTAKIRAEEEALDQVTYVQRKIAERKAKWQRLREEEEAERKARKEASKRGG